MILLNDLAHFTSQGVLQRLERLRFPQPDKLRGRSTLVGARRTQVVAHSMNVSCEEAADLRSTVVAYAILVRFTLTDHAIFARYYLCLLLNFCEFHVFLLYHSSLTRVEA